MKLVLLLTVVFCVSKQAVGETRCAAGTTSGSMTATETICPETHACSKVSGVVDVGGVTQNMEIGQCVLEAACAFMKCSTVKNVLPGSIAKVFTNCRAQCCKDGECKDVPDNGGPPIVPYGPIVPEPENPVPEQMPLIPNTGSAGGTICLAGTRMGSQPGTETTCQSTHSCSTISGTVTMAGEQQTIEVGQCILDSACSFLTCSTVKASIPDANVRRAFSNCRAQCCKNGHCRDIADTGRPPIVPYGRENLVPETYPLNPNPQCQVPMWNSVLEDNWSGIARRRGPVKPKFTLMMKKLNKGYKPNKKYMYIVKAGSKKLMMSGFFITLHSNSSECLCKEEDKAMCPVGKLLSSRKRIAGAPVVVRGCDQPAISDVSTSRTMKKQTGEWQAPNCTDAEIIMRVTVRGSDGRLYEDNDAVSEKFLTKVIRPAPSKPKKHKKPKKPKKPKRRRE